jgi:glycosyltransferase involved in cell wall biosynthesis
MFSVVIPLHNKEKSISSAIESVLSQNFKSFELIIINDGSTDASRERAGCFSDSRIQIIDQENMGVSAARNRGIKAASYPYLAFLDGDDLWEPEYLETQKELIQDYPEAGLWGCGLGILRDNVKFPFYHGVPAGYRGLIKNYFTMEKRGMLFRPSGTVIHKDVFNKVGLLDERIHFGEDLDILYRILFEFQPAFYNKNVAYYRTDAENNVLSKTKPIDQRFFYYINKFKKERVRDADFRKYFDHLTLAFMYEHRLKNESPEIVDIILEEIDFSLQKSRWKLVYAFPGLYRLYRRYIKTVKKG